MADVAADEPMSSQKMGTYARAGRSWVATDQEDHVVGYVVEEAVDGCAHIEQVSVEPGHQRPQASATCHRKATDPRRT